MRGEMAFMLGMWGIGVYFTSSLNQFDIARRGTTRNLSVSVTVYLSADLTVDL